MIREEIRTIFITDNGTECATKNHAIWADFVETLTSYAEQHGLFENSFQRNITIHFILDNALELSSMLETHRAAWVNPSLRENL